MSTLNQPPDARSTIAELVGKSIPTMTGQRNDVLRIEGDDVIVGTKRSPGGSPVEIAAIQAAIDMLWRDGEVLVDKRVVGYRSAFVGAVLQTLPGTVPSLSPRMIRLVQTSGDGGNRR